ncbi:hypothetical protein CQA77_30235, partial [Klebsiella pneumoniae]
TSRAAAAPATIRTPVARLVYLLRGGQAHNWLGYASLPKLELSVDQQGSGGAGHDPDSRGATGLPSQRRAGAQLAGL